MLGIRNYFKLVLTSEDIFEAYKDPITLTDTEYMQRNIYQSEITTILLLMFFNYKKKFLDYGGVWCVCKAYA
jgi:hypothetical protein